MPKCICCCVCLLLMSACLWGEESQPLPAPLQQALAQPEGKERDKAVIDAAVEWQKSDPAAALAWVVVQPPQNMLTRSMVGNVSQAWAKRDPAAAVAWSYANIARKPKPGVFETMAFHLSLVSWTKSDPKAALAWAEATVPADSSAIIMNSTYGSIAGGWVRKDPVAAVAWAETVKDGTNRQTAVRQIVEVYLKEGNKPDGIAALVEKLPHDNLKTAAMMIATNWAKKDTSKAQAWVGTLSLSGAEKEEILAKLK